MINYYITSSGQCSYCGTEADWVQLPDGQLERSDTCDNCDAYNLEIRTLTAVDAMEPDGEPMAGMTDDLYKPLNHFSMNIEDNRLTVLIETQSAAVVARLYEAIERVLIEIEREDRANRSNDDEPNDFSLSPRG